MRRFDTVDKVESMPILSDSDILHHHPTFPLVVDFNSFRRTSSVASLADAPEANRTHETSEDLQHSVRSS